jgi:hypothetical protein
VQVFTGSANLEAEVTDVVTSWEGDDPDHHRVNMLVTSRDGQPIVFVFLRDTRFTIASNKGLMGGWEVAGDYAYDSRREDFEAADIELVRATFAEIRPPAAGSRPHR